MSNLKFSVPLLLIGSQAIRQLPLPLPLQLGLAFLLAILVFGRKIGGQSVLIVCPFALLLLAYVYLPTSAEVNLRILQALSVGLAGLAGALIVGYAKGVLDASRILLEMRRALVATGVTEMIRRNVPPGVGRTHDDSTWQGRVARRILGLPSRPS